MGSPEVKQRQLQTPRLVDDLNLIQAYLESVSGGNQATLKALESKPGPVVDHLENDLRTVVFDGPVTLQEAKQIIWNRRPRSPDAIVPDESEVAVGDRQTKFKVDLRAWAEPNAYASLSSSVLALLSKSLTDIDPAKKLESMGLPPEIAMVAPSLRYETYIRPVTEPTPSYEALDPRGCIECHPAQKILREDEVVKLHRFPGTRTVHGKSFPADWLVQKRGRIIEAWQLKPDLDAYVEMLNGDEQKAKKRHDAAKLCEDYVLRRWEQGHPLDDAIGLMRWEVELDFKLAIWDAAGGVQMAAGAMSRRTTLEEPTYSDGAINRAAGGRQENQPISIQRPGSAKGGTGGSGQSQPSGQWDPFKGQHENWPQRRSTPRSSGPWLERVGGPSQETGPVSTVLSPNQIGDRRPSAPLLGAGGPPARNLGQQAPKPLLPAGPRAVAPEATQPVPLSPTAGVRVSELERSSVPATTPASVEAQTASGPPMKDETSSLPQQGARALELAEGFPNGFFGKLEPSLVRDSPSWVSPPWMLERSNSGTLPPAMKELRAEVEAPSGANGIRSYQSAASDERRGMSAPRDFELPRAARRDVRAEGEIVTGGSSPEVVLNDLQRERAEVLEDLQSIRTKLRGAWDPVRQGEMPAAYARDYTPTSYAERLDRLEQRIRGYQNLLDEVGVRGERLNEEYRSRQSDVSNYRSLQRVGGGQGIDAVFDKQTAGGKALGVDEVKSSQATAKGPSDAQSKFEHYFVDRVNNEAPNCAATRQALIDGDYTAIEFNVVKYNDVNLKTNQGRRVPISQGTMTIAKFRTLDGEFQRIGRDQFQRKYKLGKYKDY